MTKNNLSKCLAWLLEQDCTVSNLQHISTISIDDCGEHELTEHYEDMARLQLAPQTSIKPRLLTQKSPNGIPTPAPSRSPRDQIATETAQVALPKTPTANFIPPKTPTTAYDDSIFDIDDFDDLLDDVGQTATNDAEKEYDLPSAAVALGSAASSGSATDLRGRKRKSDEYLEDCEPYESNKHAVCPNSSSKRRNLSDVDITGKSGSNDRYAFDPAQEVVHKMPSDQDACIVPAQAKISTAPAPQPSPTLPKLHSSAIMLHRTVKSVGQICNDTSSNSPHSSGSVPSTKGKLSKDELQTLEAFLAVPLVDSQNLLGRLEASRKTISLKIAEQLSEDDFVAPELKAELRTIKDRIAALKEISGQREGYCAMSAQMATLKARLASTVEDHDDGDTHPAGAEILSEIRSLRPQIEAIECHMFNLIQKAGWSFGGEGQDTDATHDREMDDLRRNILVASTQTIRNQMHSEALPSGTPFTKSIQSSGQPVAQTPPVSHVARVHSGTRAFEAPMVFEPHVQTFARNMRSPEPLQVIDADFDDAFDDEDDMLDAAHAVEKKLEPPIRHLHQSPRPRQVLSQMSENIRREASVTASGASLPLKQYRWSKDVQNTLRNRFQLQGFRHNQLEAINATLSGKDAFVLMPTGGGKSLCYQLPSIVNSGETHGVTIVISPLLSLMQDQVDHLQKLNVQAFLINGESTREHKNQIYQALRDPHPERLVQLLYVTPEMLGKSPMMTEKFSNLHKRRKLARIVIDEAHCVSQWGHDFRPDYKALGDIRMQFDGVPVMALTATATENVKVDVIHNLRMDGCEVFTQSFNRPNLYYEVRSKPKGPQLLESIAETITTSHAGESGIIYCLSRKACENLAKQLQTRHSIKATHYHAGMDSEARIDVQKQWQAGRYDVIVATIAFGMGIDKPDVRFVIHHTIPKSLEGYYQETGRAGRDGKGSKCYLYYGYSDTTALKRMIEENKDTSWQQQERQKQMLRNVVQFCENRSDCRRVQVLAYFNEHFSKMNCHETCDNCRTGSSFEWRDFSNHAKDIVRLVQQLQDQNVTLLHCVDVYRGATNKKITDMGHKSLKQFGNGSELERGEVERLFYRLISDDAIEERNKVNGAGFALAYVSLGQQSENFLRGKKSLKIQVRTSPKPKGNAKISRKATKKTQRGTGVQAANDYPASTNVSSPIERRKSGKQKSVPNYLQQLTSEYENSGDEDLVDFAPIRKEGQPTPPRRRPLGPPITTDQKIAQLDEAHRHILQDFVDNVGVELREISMQKGLRQRPISDTVLREVGIMFPTTTADLHHIAGLPHDKIAMYGSLLLRHASNARRDYEAILNAQAEEVPGPKSQRIVEISDDEEMEENFISDDEDDDFDIDLDEYHTSYSRSNTGPSCQSGTSFQKSAATAKGKPQKKPAGQSRSFSGGSFKARVNRSKSASATTGPKSGGKKKHNTNSQTIKSGPKRPSNTGKPSTSFARGGKANTQTSLIGMMPT